MSKTDKQRFDIAVAFLVSAIAENLLSNIDLDDELTDEDSAAIAGIAESLTIVVQEKSDAGE